MSGKRSLARNVHIWHLNSDNRDRVPLGGLVLTAGVTNTDFRQMLDILLIITSSDCVVRNELGDEIERTDEPLLPGDYTVIADSVEVNNEIVYTRAHSIASGTRVESFTEQVRDRDSRCVVSKVENWRAAYGMWLGFEAAHVFPLAYEQQWVENNYGRCITIDPPRGGKIHSVQNGILLRSDLHQLFDHYAFSINPWISPFNGYKIVFFVDDLDQLGGQSLDSRLLNDPRRPPDELLRWHFRQAVLTNMRGIGEPIHGQDFPPGSDMMGEIMAGPKAAERMEFELFDRLAHHTEIL